MISAFHEALEQRVKEEGIGEVLEVILHIDEDRDRVSAVIIGNPGNGEEIKVGLFSDALEYSEDAVRRMNKWLGENRIQEKRIKGAATSAGEIYFLVVGKTEE
jgi:predicted sulfurtransferase